MCEQTQPALKFLFVELSPHHYIHRQTHKFEQFDSRYSLAGHTMDIQKQIEAHKARILAEKKRQQAGATATNKAAKLAKVSP